MKDKGLSIELMAGEGWWFLVVGTWYGKALCEALGVASLGNENVGNVWWDRAVKHCS